MSWRCRVSRRTKWVGVDGGLERHHLRVGTGRSDQRTSDGRTRSRRCHPVPPRIAARKAVSTRARRLKRHIRLYEDERPDKKRAKPDRDYKPCGEVHQVKFLIAMSGVSSWTRPSARNRRSTPIASAPGENHVGSFAGAETPCAAALPGGCHETSTFRNCQGSDVSISSGKSPGRPSRGVQSV